METSRKCVHLGQSVNLRENFILLPVIIKFVFHALTAENPLATYACINYNEAYAPEEISDRSIAINGDAEEIISRLLDNK